MDFKQINEIFNEQNILLTEDVKDCLLKFKQLYNLTDGDIKNALLKILNENKKFDEVSFERICYDLYSQKGEKVNRKEKNEKIEQLIYLFETMSPKQLLKDLTQNTVSKDELNFIEKVMADYKLNSSVMNVLIHYTLLNLNMRLSKKYIEKIASHWANKQLKTAEEAISYAQMTHARFNQFKQKAKKRSKTPDHLSKPLTIYEYRYLEKLYDQYGMDISVAKEIIYYGRKVNNGLFIYWFLDGVANYINRQNCQDRQEARESIKKFHQQYVVNFGKE